MFLQILSTLSAGLFAGAALYINLVEHPARMECGVALALREFAPSYRRATVLQATLAALGFLSAVGAWLMGASVYWLIGGSVLGLVIPFTLVVIFPTNKKLLDPALEPGSEIASRLLARWAKLHAVRSLMALTAFAIFSISLSRGL
jgi:uncharacterized membrane protein